MSVEKDLQEIINQTKALYACITYDEGGKPEPEKLRDIIMRNGGKMIINDGDAPLVMDVEYYIGRFYNKMREIGAKSFVEYEVAGHTDIFGKIANRFSTYKTEVNGRDYGMGINTIQFIKLDGVWLVSSILWNNVTDDLKIPEQYLKL